MTQGKHNDGLNLELKLDELNLSPSQRAHALSAMRTASEAVDLFEAVAGAIKRIAGVVTLKPSVRA